MADMDTYNEEQRGYEGKRNNTFHDHQGHSELEVQTLNLTASMARIVGRETDSSFTRRPRLRT